MKTLETAWKLFALTLMTGVSSVCTHAQTWMKAGPYLQELTNTGVTVVFEHGIPSLSWVELREKGSTETRNYYQTVHGQIQVRLQILGENAVEPVQNFAVRIDGLKPDTQYEYRVRGRKVVRMDAGGATMSITAANSYTSRWIGFSTLSPDRKEHHLFITSDMHNRPDTLAALLQQLDYASIDHFLYNGDMTNYVQTGDGREDPYTGYINTSVSLFAQSKAFEMVRGNHDTRGNLSRHFKDYFPRTSGEIFSASRWGDLEVVMIDCGEDKVDTHPEYYGMAAFYPYREKVAQWLGQLVKTEEFLTARHRIVVCHFPVLRGTSSSSEFDGQPHLARLILPLLLECDIDMLIAGHYHYPCTVDGLNYNGQGNRFEEYIIGSRTGMRIDISQDGSYKVKVVDSKGNVFMDKVVKGPKADTETVILTVGGG